MQDVGMQWMGQHVLKAFGPYRIHWVAYTLACHMYACIRRTHVHDTTLLTPGTYRIEKAHDRRVLAVAAGILRYRRSGHGLLPQALAHFLHAGPTWHRGGVRCAGGLVVLAVLALLALRATAAAGPIVSATRPLPSSRGDGSSGGTVAEARLLRGG